MLFWIRRPLLLLTGKGNKTRRVPIMKNTVSLLERYILENKLDKPWKNEYPLFTNNQNNKLTKEGVAYIISKYVTSARKTSTLVPSKVKSSYVSPLEGHAFTTSRSKPYIHS